MHQVGNYYLTNRKHCRILAYQCYLADKNILSADNKYPFKKANTKLKKATSKTFKF